VPETTDDAETIAANVTAVDGISITRVVPPQFTDVITVHLTVTSCKKIVLKGHARTF